MIENKLCTGLLVVELESHDRVETRSPILLAPRLNDALVGIDFNRNYYHRNDNVRGGTSVVDALNPKDGNYLDSTTR